MGACRGSTCCLVTWCCCRAAGVLKTPTCPPEWAHDPCQYPGLCLLWAGAQGAPGVGHLVGLALLAATVFLEQKLSGSHKTLVEMQDLVAELLRSATREHPATKVRRIPAAAWGDGLGSLFSRGSRLATSLLLPGPAVGFPGARSL